jgi:hypothetical protein
MYFSQQSDSFLTASSKADNYNLRAELKAVSDDQADQIIRELRAEIEDPKSDRGAE